MLNGDCDVLEVVVVNGDSRVVSTFRLLLAPLGEVEVFNDNRLLDVAAMGEPESEPESLGVPDESPPRSKFRTRALFDRLCDRRSAGTSMTAFPRFPEKFENVVEREKEIE
jgi:hypothetical protein